MEEGTTENKADEPLISIQSDNQRKEDKDNKNSWIEALHSFGYSVKEIAQDSQVNMSWLITKLYHLNFYLKVCI